jgi:streptomycin 6-kinase
VFGGDVEQDRTMIDVPTGLARATTIREGSSAAAWLAALPALVDRLLVAWECEVDGTPTHGQVALVLPVRRHGRAAVLKVSFPHPGNRGEPLALRAFDGRGAVALLDADEDAFAMLLERASDRTLDSVHSADEAIEIAGDLARRLAVSAPPSIPALADTAAGWEAELDAQVVDCPEDLDPAVLDRARSTIRDLAGDPGTTMLHGDLHFGNVLGADRETWLAIDPKGWRGSAAYDAFTVAAGKPGELHDADDIERALLGRIRRFARAADVDSGAAIALAQARATSSYLYERLHAGDPSVLGMLRLATGLAA